jgi:6-phospho-3-hexuloisomerase
VHVAKQAVGYGAHLLAVTSNSTSALGKLADAIIEVPAPGSQQFGGSLFEQGALLLLDALVLDLTTRDPEAHEQMAARHTNLE